MKPALLFIVACPLLSMAGTSMGEFEGTIETTLTRGSYTENCTYSVASNTLRVARNETDHPYATNLVTLDTGDITLIFPHNRSFMRLKPRAKTVTRPDGFPEMPLPPTDQRGYARVVGSTVDIGAVEYQGASDLAGYWPLDWDGDGNAFGVEFALGTDWLTPDAEDPANLSIFEIDGHAGVTFGWNPSALGYTAWVLKRSIDLETGPFVEICRFDGATVTILLPGSQVDLIGNRIQVIDRSFPPPNFAFYVFEAEMSP